MGNPTGDKGVPQNQAQETTGPLERKTRKPFDFLYFREAKLFANKDRATLTFFLGQEVASIHYDLKRNEIFFKGHNVKNMTLSPEQWQSLQRFSDLLASEKVDPELVRSYQECLSQIPPPH